jgi:MFS family permease
MSGSSPATRLDLDDRLVAIALAAVALLCAAFRYLPMTDLPQHYAMVSILRHHGDPAYDFAHRYTFDFLGRPYATVYWLGAALAWVMPLGAAMHVLVIVCTLAPFVGTYAWLRATGRSRSWLLAVIPFAFGSLWHWGFLNFLLGTGLFLGGLAVVVYASQAPSRRRAIALLVVSIVALFTHFHGLVMLLAFAPVVAWAYLGDRASPRVMARVLSPLAPSAVAAVAFVLLTWSQAEGAWVRLNPGLRERLDRFPEFLGAGLRDPWPLAGLVAFALLAALGMALGDPAPPAKRERWAFAFVFAAQIGMYLFLPLNTNTATYVSARHALLVVLTALPLLPALTGVGAIVVRAIAGAVCLAGLAVNAQSMACFDREARDFEPVLEAMQPGRRVASLIYARSSACGTPRSFPYLHFAGYYQAARGGDLAHSFAVVWNVPMRYRSDYPRYAFDERLEWAPDMFGPNELAHFDYVLVRGSRVPRLPGVRVAASSGAWTLLENPFALPDVLPP